MHSGPSTHEEYPNSNLRSDPPAAPGTASSLCSYVLSQETNYSLVAQTMHSGLSTVQESLNFNLQSDPSADNPADDVTPHWKLTTMHSGPSILQESLNFNLQSDPRRPAAPGAASSLCSYVQSPAYQSTSQDTSCSFDPKTMHSDLSTLQDNLNFSLQSHPTAVESKIERYIRMMHIKYNEVLELFMPDNYFTGSLYSNHILTRDQLNQIRWLLQQPGGKAEALGIIQYALCRVGDKAAEPFLMALVDPDSRQDALALLIDREQAEQLIRERDNPVDDVTRDAGESTVNAQEPVQCVDSIRDYVDFARPNKPPSDTAVKVAVSDVHDPNETSVKKVEDSEVSKMPPIDPTEKADDVEECRVDPPATDPSKCSQILAPDDDVSSMT